MKRVMCYATAVVVGALLLWDLVGFLVTLDSWLRAAWFIGSLLALVTITYATMVSPGPEEIQTEDDFL